MREKPHNWQIFLFTFIESIIVSIPIGALAIGMLSFFLWENKFNLETIFNGIFIRLYLIGLIVTLYFLWNYNNTNYETCELVEGLFDRVPRRLQLISNELDADIRTIRFFSANGSQSRPPWFAASQFFGEVNRNEQRFKSAINEGVPIYSSKGDIVDIGSHDFQTNLQRYKGGIIVFVANAKSDLVLGSPDTLSGKVKKFYFTAENLLKKKKKLLRLARRLNKGNDPYGKSYVGGFSINKSFFGKFTDNDTENVFNEKSVTIEALGMSSSILTLLAAQFATDRKQETVLVRDFNLDRFYLVSSKKVFEN